MGLDRSLIKEFMEVTDSGTQKKERTVYASVAGSSDGKVTVNIEDSDFVTPAETMVDVSKDDRVMVSIKDHKATIIGNITSKAVGGNQLAQKVDVIVADSAYIKTLFADLGAFNELYADVGAFKELTANDFIAVNATIDNLDSTYATIKHLEANYADIEELNSAYASISELNAVSAKIGALDVEKLDANFANIDRSDITKANIQELYAVSGLIQETFTENATVTGYLNGVKIRGDLIEAETIIADKLMIQGENGLYYKLNVDLGGVTPGSGITKEDLQNGLHGTNIIADTITADKISVSDLTAIRTKLANFTVGIDENTQIGELYSGVKDSIDNTTKGIYLSSDGQMSIGDSKNFLRYYKDIDDSYKLELSMSDNLIGAQNLLIESGRWTRLPTYWKLTATNTKGMYLTDKHTYQGYKTLQICFGAGLGGIVGNNDQWMELDPTKTYTYSALMYSDSFYNGQDAWVPLDFQVSSDGVNMSTEHTIIIIRATNKLTPGEWNFVHVTFKVPTEARYAKLFVHGGEDTPECRVYIAHLQLEEGTTPTAWRPESYTNFMTFDSNGIQVGNHIGGTWTGYRTQTTGDSYNILDENGVTVAKYGADQIDLGVNSPDSRITLCGGTGMIRHWEDSNGIGRLGMSSDYLSLMAVNEVSLLAQAVTSEAKTVHMANVDVNPYQINIRTEASYDYESHVGSFNSSELTLTSQTGQGLADGKFYVLSDKIHDIGRWKSTHEVLCGPLEFIAHQGDIDSRCIDGNVRYVAENGFNKFQSGTGDTASTFELTKTHGSIALPNGSLTITTAWKTLVKSRLAVSDGNKNTHNDGIRGCFIGVDGTMHLSHNTGGTIAFHYANSTANTSTITEVESGKLAINGVVYGVNAVLWSGVLYMQNGHTADLSAPITSQPNGIVLVFSRYVDGKAENGQFNTFFVPKSQVSLHWGSGHVFTMSTLIPFGVMCSKYLYINGSSIVGHANNITHGTAAGSTIVYDNEGFVLRYVIGV